jgi:hypothetical protein
VAAEGNREEEARWANVICDIHKRCGEYVEALRWLRIDYEVSVKHLPQRHLIESCQSLGEVYLRLGQFSEALTYQVTAVTILGSHELAFDRIGCLGCFATSFRLNWYTIWDSVWSSRMGFVLLSPTMCILCLDHLVVHMQE